MGAAGAEAESYQNGDSVVQDPNNVDSGLQPASGNRRVQAEREKRKDRKAQIQENHNKVNQNSSNNNGPSALTANEQGVAEASISSTDIDWFAEIGYEKLSYIDPFAGLNPTGFDPTEPIPNLVYPSISQEDLDKAELSLAESMSIRETFETVQQAAVRAMLLSNGMSIRTDTEYGGKILYKGTGFFGNKRDFYYTFREGEPGAGFVNPGLKYSQTVAMWHTHGASAGRFSLYDPEEFSPTDINVAKKWNVPSYLITPSGKMWVGHWDKNSDEWKVSPVRNPFSP